MAVRRAGMGEVEGRGGGRLGASMIFGGRSVGVVSRDTMDLAMGWVCWWFGGRLGGGCFDSGV